MTQEQGSTFKDDLAGSLASPTQDGMFARTTTTESGRTVTQRYSLAVGWGSRFRKSAYEEKFGQPIPDWAEQIHPYHLCVICDLAIEREQTLPAVRPQ